VVTNIFITKMAPRVADFEEDSETEEETDDSE
jgi:hypothetical protein